MADAAAVAPSTRQFPQAATPGEGSIEELVYSFGEWLESVGVWAYVLAPLAMTVVAILPIPAEFPAMLNGMMFGPVLGTAFTWGGALAGAQLSFELSRWLGRPLAERLIPAAHLARADQVALRSGWWGMLLPRLIPLVAFTALNWAAGLVAVPRWRFFWTTAVGTLPGAVAFTLAGVGLATLPARLPAVLWAAAGLVALYLGFSQLKRRPAAPFGLWCGVAGPILWLALIAAAGAIRPDFSHLTHYISELGERGSSTEALVRIGAFGVTGCLYVCFALAVFRGSRGRPLRQIAALLIALDGIGRMGAGVFPCEAGCVPPASGPNLHMLFATLGFSSGVMAALLWGTLLRRAPGSRRLSSFSIASGLVALVALLLLFGPPLTALPAGALEHLATVVLSVWLFVLAASLLRADESRVG